MLNAEILMLSCSDCSTVANLVYLDCELQFTIGDYDDFSVALLESKVVKNFKLLKE